MTDRLCQNRCVRVLGGVGGANAPPRQPAGVLLPSSNRDLGGRSVNTDKLTFYLCENELLLRRRMETPRLDGMEGEKSPVWHSVFVNYV